ncbi:RNA-binding protein 42 [Dissophora globulifera]|uniref:RNA-binding protein 42 n=1 Tax=Dissophora globulifera TaxID=979702 RepID=A0A9P6RN89_9FUNG|nr:RNA-binding protein 42 [Dissophora globulifera]
MSYAHGAAGGAAPQYTPEEIAYWESLGYVMDPSYAAAPAPAVDPNYAQYQQQPSYNAVGASIPGSSIPVATGAPYNAGSTGGHRGGYYQGGGGGRYNAGYGGAGNEYEDLNKIFVDPKKAQEEAAAAAARAEEEEKAAKAKAAATVVRKAAGLVWEDSSLLEFDENDFRLFAGDLGNEVTDELLTKTFSKYPSFLKAKVVRDKRTLKTKGYGFISFSEPEDFARAWKEMNGKYVGNRPIKLRKSQWKDRNVEIVREAKAARGPYDPEALTRKERAKPYKVKKLNNAGK